MERGTVTLKSIGSFLKKLKYPLLILGLGVVLLLWPSRTAQTQDDVPEPMGVSVQEPTMQEQMEEILSCVEGAGKVRVLLTMASGEETVYQTDVTEAVGADGSTNRTVSTVLANQSGSGEAPVVSQIIYGKYQGAVVVCEGAERAAVRLELVNAVAGLTGLPTDRITVIKMKS